MDLRCLLLGIASFMLVISGFYILDVCAVVDPVKGLLI